MQIRQATIDDTEDIISVYLQTFHKSEAQIVADVAASLLHEQYFAKVISLVAIINIQVVGHIAFSPVMLENNSKHIGYIMAPLAVLPAFQKNKIGTRLIQHGLQAISKMGPFIIFVYGDPNYYMRFGFEKDLAGNYIPPYTLQFPEGWQALNLNSSVSIAGGHIVCVESLNRPNLW